MKSATNRFLSFIFFICQCLALCTDQTNIIFLTIDGVRWQEIFNGTDARYVKGVSSAELLPNITNRFVNQGIVIGKDGMMVASGPSYYSVPGYLEMLRGHSTKDCLYNTCNFDHEKTFLNLLYTKEQVGVFSSWDRIGLLASQKQNEFVINSGRFYRSTQWNALQMGDLLAPIVIPGHPNYRGDIYTEMVAVEYLMANNPKFLWISLGDTDEWAHKAQYDKYIAALQQVDNFVDNLFVLLDTLYCYKNNSVVIMTTDHGRGRGDDWVNHGWVYSANRVWLMVAGKNIPHLGYFSPKRKVTLSDIFPFVKSVQESSTSNLW